MTSGSVTSLSHNRYTKNMEGSPQSSSLSHHFPLSNEKMGMGAVITDDRIGVTSHTSAVIAYSYKLFFIGGRSVFSWKIYVQVFSFGVNGKRVVWGKSGSVVVVV